MSEPRMDKVSQVIHVSQMWAKGEIGTSQERAKSEPIEPRVPSESKVS